MSDSAEDARGLVRDLQSAFGSATNQIKTDLERAKTLVRDATARLTRSFEILHAAAAAQREALQSVSSALYDGGHGGGSFAATTEALMRRFVDEIVRVSRDSMRIMEQVSDLQTYVAVIVECADAIDGLARETRFISFNARIETHRAGEAGRTFKVVADEVKRLASVSSNLSTRIRQSIGQCNQQLASMHSTSIGLASHDLTHALESHKGLTVAINRLDGVNQQLDDMLAAVATSMDDAVRALQFEDMVSQVLSLAISQVQTLGECSIRALQFVQVEQSGERSAPLRAVLESVRALYTRASVVQQASLEQGTVELF
jgi:methyl-accepting chemotaxis protein